MLYFIKIRKTPHQLQTFPYSKQTLRASALKRPRHRRVHRRVLSWVGHVPDRAALAFLRRAVARRCDCAGLAVLLRIALSRRDIRRRTWRDARSLGLLRQVSLAKQAASRPRPREMSSPGGFDHHAATTNGWPSLSLLGSATRDDFLLSSFFRAPARHPAAPATCAIHADGRKSGKWNSRGDVKSRVRARCLLFGVK